jgi:hypothetical protein
MVPTPDAVLAFANSYGRLGIAGPWRPPPGATEPRIYGESLVDWYAEIEALREQVDVWDLVRHRDLQELARRVRWRDNLPPPGEERLVTVYPGSYPVDPRSERLGGERDAFDPADIIGPALASIQVNVNQHLSDRVAPRLLSIPRLGEMRVFLVPNDLLGALWLQFALALAGEKDHQQCARCGTWFEISPERSRPDRVFCSTACRSKAYRRRKELARELHAAGKSFKEIAAELGSKAQQVKKWVASTGGQRS